jgi:hypothetical protein
MKFGFLIDPKSFECDGFKIAPVIEFDSVLNNFYKTTSVSKGWFYGPKIELVQSFREKEDFALNPPIVHESFFHMSPTHRMTSTENYSDDHLKFLTLGYGFLQGLYLTPENYSYLGRTAFKPTTLNGLLLGDSDYINGMECINRFYINSNEENRNQMFACIHWYLISQSYEFAWDRFDAQYKVLDGIYKLSGTKADSHAARPIALSEKYNLELPLWAKLITKKESKLSKQRNELFHEAKYGGYPIGYSYPEENYNLEFRSFNTKLIAAALGINTPYLQAEPKNRILGMWNIKS